MNQRLVSYSLDEFRCAIRIGALRADHDDGTRTGIVNCERFTWTKIDAGVGRDVMGMPVDENGYPPATAGGTDFAPVGTLVLPAKHIQNLIAVIVANSRRQTWRKLHYAQRDCLGSRRAANAIPNAQRARDQRIAFAHFGHLATAFKSYSHAVSLY